MLLRSEKIFFLLILALAFLCPKLHAIEDDHAGEPEPGLRSLLEFEINWNLTSQSKAIKPVFVNPEPVVPPVLATEESPPNAPVKPVDPSFRTSSNSELPATNGNKGLGGRSGSIVEASPSTEVNGFLGGATEDLNDSSPPGTGNMAALEQGIKSVENFGKLPLPIARVSKEDPYANNRVQNLAVGDLGGSPYGPYAGKTTFGSTGSDETLQGLMANSNSKGDNSGDGATGSGTGNFPLDFTYPPKEVDPVKLEALKQDMDKLAQKADPFKENDYKTYERAKSLFKENHQLIGKMNDLDEDFVKNARELYVDHSWQDMDKKGREPFADFIRRNEPKLSFPYPIGKEPKPKTHRGDPSH